MVCVSLHYLMDCPIPQGSCINSFVYSSFSLALVSDGPHEEDDESESEEDDSNSVRHRVAFGCPKMALRKWSHGPYGLQRTFPTFRNCSMCTTSTHHPMEFLDPVQKAMPIFLLCVTAHAPSMQLRQDMLQTCTQPRQTGSPRGCYRAGEVLRKGIGGNYGKRVSCTTQKTVHHSLHCALYLPHTQCPQTAYSWKGR